MSYRDKFARATTTFTGAAGNYDVIITALGETDGECSFRLLVNGVVIGTKQNARVTSDYGPQLHTFNNVAIPAGATLGVESNDVSNGLIPEGTGFAYARGRWTTLTLTLATSTSTSTGIPVANAGADKTVTLPTSSVTLNGSATDDGGTITTYAWTRISGPNTPALAGASTTTLTASGLIQGTYVFRLTVTDNDNQTHYDDVNVSVITPGTARRHRLRDPVTLLEESESTAQGGDVQMSAGVLTFNAPVGFVGIDTFPLTVSDGKGGEATADLTVNIVDSSTAIGSASPSFTTLPDGSHQLGFQGVPHLEYTVQRSINLGAWAPIATVKADAGGVISFSDPNPPEGQAFYRLEAP
ncbi:PKD domain-containing protein [Haloferula sp.]|uniref:PKD domain-containing protein n=1 Tax=Haloferula sp. TaxID=2497595 RepID=UPI003C74D386